MIETNRLILRPWRDSDRAPFAALNADPEVRRFFPSMLDRAGSDAQIDRFIAKWAADGFAFAAAERKADGVFVGMIGILRNGNDGPIGPCVEIGWRLARVHWGQGYATEGARAWMRHGFETLGLPEIVAFTLPDNTASQAVMLRLGMAHDPARDCSEAHPVSGNPPIPLRVYALSRAAWAGN